MKTVIDELSLKINIKTKKDIDKTISSIATAINKLNRAVANVSNLKKYVNTLNSLTNRTLKVVDATPKSKEMASSSQPSVEYETLQSSTVEMQKQIAFLKEKNNRFKIGNNNLKSQLSTIKKINLEQKPKEPKIEDIKNENAMFLNKFFKSIGRIALYRAIRTVLNQIVKGTIEGLNNLREFDEELDISIRNLSQSYTTIKNSFASILSPVVKVLAPLVTKIADTFANIANNIAQAEASLNGQATYMKILTSESEEYQNNLKGASDSLLEFDKFSSLEKSKNGYTGVTEALVEDNKGLSSTMDLLTQIYDTVNAIIDILKSAWVILKPLIMPVFDVVGGVLTQISSVIQTISGFLKLLTGDFEGFWNNIKNGFADMVNGIANMFIGLANFIINLLNIVFVDTNPIFWLLKGLGVVGSDFGIPEIQARVNWQPFADGGMVKRGTYFYAGESGAEIVANTSGGKTGVTNIAQFKTAMVQALAEYGVARNGRVGDTVLQVNGKEFARATANDMAGALSQKYRVNFQPR